MYHSKWHGSTDPDDKSGVAAFTVKDVDYDIRLGSFQEYQQVCEMLKAAFDDGKHFAANVMRSRIERAMENVSSEF